MLLKAHSALLATILAVAAVLHASAQGFNPDEVKRMQASMPDIGRPYSIRVTTGATTNAGFEKALTDTDPNLKHWTWIPTTNFNQAYIRVAPGQVDKGRPSFQRPRSVYVKPVAVALPRVNRTDLTPQAIAYRNKNMFRSRSDVHATVSYSKAPAVAAETKVYTYGDVSGRLSAPRYTAAYSDSRDVYGKLVSRTQTH